MANYRYVTKAQAIAIMTAAKAAYTNQDAIAKIKVGDNVYTADEAQDQIELLAGTNVAISSSNGVLTFSATDTTYADVVASSATSGLMTGADKAKLDGIEAGAEVNQNAYSNIKVGADTVAADAKTDTFELAAGGNVTLSIDASGVVTIAAADTTYTIAQDTTDGHIITFTPSTGSATTITIPDSDTTYDEVTQTVAGLMSAADKVKLDGIEAGAQVNVLEGVKVNGTALTATNKVVDVTVVEGTANGTVAVNGSDVSVHGLGTAAFVATESTLANDGNVPTGAAVTAAIDAKVAAVYKPGGSVAASGLTSALLVAANEGKVYNLSDALTVTDANKALFVENAAGSYPAGTNVEVIEATEGTYKFDVLAGFVDLSPYVEKNDLGGLTDAELAEVIAAL